MESTWQFFVTFLGWWKRDPFQRSEMAREISGISVIANIARYGYAG